MKRISIVRLQVTVCVAALALIQLLPTSAQAQGHRIVATVATGFLSDNARAGVEELLGDVTLASVANWADNVRNSRPETAEWHFVDIPLRANTLNRQRDCADGNCVVTAIEAQKAILVDRSKPKRERAEALKFIIHFVGDLHQPLHCADNNDRGGNNTIVKFLGKRSKLHGVWDSGIIVESGLPEEEFAEELLAGIHNPPAGRTADIQKGTPEEWAIETHKLAQTNAYKLTSNKVLGVAYYNTNAPAVDDQLTRASLRLAKLLSDVFE